MNTIVEAVLPGRRRRRRHSDEFKAEVIRAARVPGVSIAAVALNHGLNANLLRRWVLEQEGKLAPARVSKRKPIEAVGKRKRIEPIASFVPLSVHSAGVVSGTQIRIEFKQGRTVITASWPIEAASQCSAWLRKLLR